MNETDTPVDNRKPAEEWAALKKSPDWLFAGARAKHQWAIGQVLTEAAFDKAMKDTGDIRCGYDIK